MEDYEELTHEESPKDGKLLRNMAIASLMVGLALALILDYDSIRGPNTGGNASRFTMMFISSLMGRAVALMIVPLVVLGVARTYSYAFNKPKKSMSSLLWAIWAILGFMSIAGQFMRS